MINKKKQKKQHLQKSSKIPANMIPLTHECMAAHLPDIVQVHRSKLVRLIFFLSPNPPSLFSINNLKIC